MSFSNTNWFLGGVAACLFVVLGVMLVAMKSEKTAPNLDGAGRVNGAGRAVDPSPGPPAPWPAYDGGPMHPGEHLYQLITSDDKGVYSRSIDVLPKLLGDDIPPPPSPHKGAPDHK